MRSSKQPDNQLNLIDEFEAASRPPVPEKSKEEKDAVADRVIKEIYKKIEIAAQKAKDREKKITMVSIKDIRDEIKKEKTNAEEQSVIKKAEEVNEKITLDETEAFTPAEEYYGRWNSFRKPRTKR